MNENLKILLWGDNRTQADIIEEELSGAYSPCSLVKADSQESFLGELEKTRPNVIIAGRRLTETDHELLQKIALEKNPDVIFIFITSQLGSELAIELIGRGGYEFKITGEESKFVDALRKTLRTAASKIKAREEKENFTDLSGKLEEAFDGIAKIESSGRLLSFNGTFLSLFGYVESEMLAFSVLRLIQRSDREIWQDAYEKMLHKSKARTEIRFNRKNGEVFYGRILLLRNTDCDDRFKGYYFFIEDISEEKKSEQSSRELRHLASSVLDSFKNEIAIIDGKGEIIAVNKAWNSFLLRSGGDLKKGSIGTNYLDVCEKAKGKDSEGGPEAAEQIRKVIRGEVQEETLEYSCDSITEKKWYKCRITRFNGEGRARAIITHIDITEKKISELGLVSSEDKFRSLVQNSSDLITIVGKDGSIQYSSPSEERILGYKPEDRIGQNLFDIIHPDDIQKVKDLFKNKINVPGAIVTDESWIKKADDTYICMETIANNLFHDPNVQGIVMNSRDITDRKYDEEMLKAALTEKEALLKEVHHRVKNNLQMVISLLKLQENHISDKTFKTIFHESVTRIKTMATIHQNLYHDYSLSHINFGKYLEHIVSHLKEIYDTENKNIKCRLVADNVRLNLETAIPCGLLVNEILSNAMQHAFKYKDSGEIIIKLESGGRSILTIEDNGVGLRPGIDPENPKTLGFELIKTLSNQLNADIEIFGENGTKFVIKFNNLNYRERIC